VHHLYRWYDWLYWQSTCAYVEDDFQQAFATLISPLIKSKHTDIDIVAFSHFANVLDSTNIQPSDWCVIASEIVNDYSDYDAFIVLHGTDTMAWTASALSFLLTG
jgi:L-asparaginase